MLRMPHSRPIRNSQKARPCQGIAATSTGVDVAGHPELRISTSAHTKHPGRCVDLRSRGTQNAPPGRIPRCPHHQGRGIAADVAAPRRQGRAAVFAFLRGQPSSPFPPEGRRGRGRSHTHWHTPPDSSPQCLALPLHAGWVLGAHCSHGLVMIIQRVLPRNLSVGNKQNKTQNKLRFESMRTRPKWVGYVRSPTSTDPRHRCTDLRDGQKL